MTDRQPATREKRRKTTIPKTADEAEILALAELPESHLTDSELQRLDAYIAMQVCTIRQAWTVEDEASRRGVDFRRMGRTARLLVHDGRIFQDDYGGLEPLPTPFGDWHESVDEYA